MNEIRIQEKQLYDHLLPLFSEHGYALQPHTKQFRKQSRNGFRAALLSVSGDRQEQTIDLSLSIRMDVVEELVYQFLSGPPRFSMQDSTTIVASYGRLNRDPYTRFVVRGEDELQEVCQRIETYMVEKGFRFLERFDHLKKIDALINRAPDKPCPYLYNQIHRCYRGIIIAKLTCRTDYNKLVKTYLKYLQNQWAPRSVITNYKKLVKFLKYFSLN
ncbi:hypothetical protein [Cesiribacter andamanensis]|uniref:Uncharacterized protein n=1 Tax=Cesiribacter andamanensis AMV16 TaxID=1279009 RepID=M7NAQ9_9BACT|nr:hypothetical protein [Cesiribacter andamanensis]EMR04342.1 hypothetical protein ADICEAN_00505 [Cesiribacter andamanensis AMV16]